MHIDRLPLKGNHDILLTYWREHLTDWPMEPGKCLRLTEEAAPRLWLYAAYSDRSPGLQGLLVNEEGSTSALWLLHVAPAERGRCLGTTLFDAALGQLSGRWVAGCGTGYWWQGVPEGGADSFLERRGFSWSWTSVDMMADLRGWHGPDPPACASIGFLTEGETPQLLAMLSGEPDLCTWLPYYRRMCDEAQHDAILVHRCGGAIGGCAMILTESDIRWSIGIGGTTGGIGCLGVAASLRGRGIGMALATVATAELKSRGYDHSYIGYTWLEGWYGRLGYRTICRQKMGERGASVCGTIGVDHQ